MNAEENGLSGVQKVVLRMRIQAVHREGKMESLSELVFYFPSPPAILSRCNTRRLHFSAYSNFDKKKVASPRECFTTDGKFVLFFLSSLSTHALSRIRKFAVFFTARQLSCTVN